MWRDMARTATSGRKAAVIGSGFGGLGAAIRLQSAGIETVLYEARDLPGGRAYVYEDEGFTFDAGPTVITAPHTLTDLFELTDRRLEDYIRLMEVQPMYRLIWSDGDRFDYVRDEEKMVAQIAERSPATFPRTYTLALANAFFILTLRNDSFAVDSGS